MRETGKPDIQELPTTHVAAVVYTSNGILLGQKKADMVNGQVLREKDSNSKYRRGGREMLHNLSLSLAVRGRYGLPSWELDEEVCKSHGLQFPLVHNETDLEKIDRVLTAGMDHLGTRLKEALGIQIVNDDISGLMEINDRASNSKFLIFEVRATGTVRMDPTEILGLGFGSLHQKPVLPVNDDFYQPPFSKFYRALRHDKLTKVFHRVRAYLSILEIPYPYLANWLMDQKFAYMGKIDRRLWVDMDRKIPLPQSTPTLSIKSHGNRPVNRMAVRPLTRSKTARFIPKEGVDPSNMVLHNRMRIGAVINTTAGTMVVLDDKDKGKPKKLADIETDLQRADGRLREVLEKRAKFKRMFVQKGRLSLPGGKMEEVDFEEAGDASMFGKPPETKEEKQLFYEAAIRTVIREVEEELNLVVGEVAPLMEINGRRLTSRDHLLFQVRASGVVKLNRSELSGVGFIRRNKIVPISDYFMQSHLRSFLTADNNRAISQERELAFLSNIEIPLSYLEEWLHLMNAAYRGRCNRGISPPSIPICTPNLRIFDGKTRTIVEMSALSSLTREINGNYIPNAKNSRKASRRQEIVKEITRRSQAPQATSAFPAESPSVVNSLQLPPLEPVEVEDTGVWEHGSVIEEPISERKPKSSPKNDNADKPGLARVKPEDREKVSSRYKKILKRVNQKEKGSDDSSKKTA